MTKVFRTCLLTGIAVFYGIPALGQSLIARLEDSLSGNDIFCNQVFFTQSNVFTRSFLSAGDWSYEARKEQLDQTDGRIRLGFGNQVHLQWKFRKSDSTSHIFEWKYLQYSGVSVDKPLAELAFFGNDPFKGREITFDKSSWVNTEITALMVKRFASPSPKKDMLFGTGLGVLIGSRYRSSDISDGSFYTDSLSEYIEGDASFKSIRNQSTLLNGIGVGISLHYALKDTRSRWIFDLSEFGVLMWPHSKQIENKSTSQRFEGFYIADIANPGDNWLDTFEQAYLQHSEGITTSLSPFLIRMVHSRVLNKFWSLDATLAYRYLPGFKPQGSILLSRLMARNLWAMGLTYGGWGLLRSDLAFFIPFTPQFSMHLNAQGLESLIGKKAPFTAYVRSGIALKIK